MFWCTNAWRMNTTVKLINISVLIFVVRAPEIYS